jgi:hypothetical protein
MQDIEKFCINHAIRNILSNLYPQHIFTKYLFTLLFNMSREIKSINPMINSIQYYNFLFYLYLRFVVPFFICNYPINFLYPFVQTLSCFQNLF